VLLYLPVLAWLIADGRMTGAGLLYATGAGVFSSVIPYAIDLIALRRVPPRYFGVVMSVHPVFAALAGLVLLGEALRPHEWLGILIVAVVNVLGASSKPVKAFPVRREQRYVASVREEARDGEHHQEPADSGSPARDGRARLRPGRGAGR
jgi:inner membrane transporter RhtA